MSSLASKLLLRVTVITVGAALCLAHAAPVYQQGTVRRPDGAAIAYYVREGAGPIVLLGSRAC
jgi:hypothetical protein